MEEFAVCLRHCGDTSDLVAARQTHARILKSKHRRSVYLANLMIQMYGKCGCVEDARAVEMPEYLDTVSWNTMITAYAQNGHLNHGIAHFFMLQVEGIAPDEVTFMTILTACSRIGMLATGLECFMLMQRDHGLEPSKEHFNTMIDILSRAGELQNAKDLINSMPHSPNDVSLGSLLGACELDQNSKKLGAQAAARMDPKSPSPYISMAGLFAKSSSSAASVKVTNVR
ncbi:hypothetical protein SELMODRAFT_106227 [Selaginella moellendorffii]|uniref:Pentacotripeptide-repeat region of PRORP domain-containing protein n=1 Tax=Selaginella moellendorffii TaxID=88036 RepID=D8S1H7_SELML|nr:hypothetical protein SELMODRAFT_106227 [Selaginella moellendorffii]